MEELVLYAMKQMKVARMFQAGVLISFVVFRASVPRSWYV